MRPRIIVFYLIFVMTALSLTGCLSYRQIYGGIDDGAGRMIFETLLYWSTPERMNAIIAAPQDKRNMMFSAEVEQISAKLGMETSAFKRQQINRVKYANMNFGYLTKGMFTDKGRIWIKYGEPGQIRDAEDDDVYGTVDKWTYSDTMKTFVFSEKGVLLNPIEDDI